jgi:hypothetical protein
MLKQAALGNFDIPLDVLFIFAEEVDLEILPSLQITFPLSRSSSLTKCLQRISRYAIPLETSYYGCPVGNVDALRGPTGAIGIRGPTGAIGIAGPTGITGATGSINYVFDKGIIILSPSQACLINMPDMNPDLCLKCVMIIDYLRSVEKYSFVLASMLGEDWYK